MNMENNQARQLYERITASIIKEKNTPPENRIDIESIKLELATKYKKITGQPYQINNPPE